MTNFQPELWVEGADASVKFYAAAFGAVTLHRVGEGEHGWRVGRIVDPYGHEWEIGRPVGAWPTTEAIAARRKP